jgi:hypothetical protein
MNRRLWAKGSLVLAISWSLIGGAMKPGDAQESPAGPGPVPEQRAGGDTKEMGAKDHHGPDAKSRRSMLEERQKRLEGQIREWMAKAGVDDESSQSAIIAHITSEVRSRRPIRDASRKLFQTMQADSVPEEQMRSQLAEFRAALNEDKVRRQEAEAALDAKIHYTQKPRLEAMLLVFGIIGEGPLLIPGSQRGPGEPGSRSDRGRGQRGPGEDGSREDRRRRDQEPQQKEQSPAAQTSGRQGTTGQPLKSTR